jgi:hypothetical protein
MKPVRFIVVAADENPELAELARQRRVELEALAGVDIETLGRPESAAATKPATFPVQ